MTTTTKRDPTVRVTLVTAFGVFGGATRAEADAKLRLATTAATGREPDADDAAAITVLRLTAA